ncbi:RNA methyltransferase [Microbulbifer sp. A4B17]|uniref:TrmH family RNA methyltransferase n=1 Tax=Microbulbifer sp. A4B17 TaxID=359370 RepID=UPI000D52B083|nr:TrmH family RNA methyltransferase [Microbulbifer sp. A4B17]AWF82322.1 RNA methyltransferase [Microbulbifer sp. A4B17]
MQTDHSNHQPNVDTHPFCYLATDIGTPSNVGGLFRIADALGVEKIYLTGESLAPPNSKIRKVSRSTEKYVPYEYHLSAVKVAKSLQDKGYRLICLEISSNSIELRHAPVSKGDKICLVLGSEKDGVAAELLEMADVVVHIPMQGINSSMNVTSACAIATYALLEKI